MLRSIYTITFLLCFKTLAIAQTGELQGKITDQNGKAVELANVVVEQNGTIKGGAEADFDGTYSIKPLQAGTYDVKVSYVGYQTSITTGVEIKADIITFLNVTLDSPSDDSPEIVIKSYKIPVFEKDITSFSFNEDKKIVCFGGVVNLKMGSVPPKDTYDVTKNTIPLFEKDNTTQGVSLSGDDIYLRHHNRR